MRTGAVVGVGAKYLARPGAEIVGLIGAGVINRTQLMALHASLKQRAAAAGSAAEILEGVLEGVSLGGSWGVRPPPGSGPPTPLDSSPGRLISPHRVMQYYLYYFRIISYFLVFFLHFK